MTLISRDDLRHQLNLLINNKPFDCEPYHDGQYAGLRVALRIVNAMPEAKRVHDTREELPWVSSAK